MTTIEAKRNEIYSNHHRATLVDSPFDICATAELSYHTAGPSIHHGLSARRLSSPQPLSAAADSGQWAGSRSTAYRFRHRFKCTVKYLPDWPVHSATSIHRSISARRQNFRATVLPAAAIIHPNYRIPHMQESLDRSIYAYCGHSALPHTSSIYADLGFAYPPTFSSVLPGQRSKLNALSVFSSRRGATCAHLIFPSKNEAPPIWM